MSKQGKDVSNQQEPREGPPGSLHTEDMFRTEEIPLSTGLPRPPQSPAGSNRRHWYVAAAVIIIVGLILGAGVILFAQLVHQPGGHVTPTPTTPGASIT